MTGTGPDTGRKNLDAQLGWEGQNKKSQLRNRNAIRHLQTAVISPPSSAGEGKAGQAGRQLPRATRALLSAREPGLGIPPRPQHQGPQRCELRLRDPLLSPPVHRTCLHTRAHGGAEREEGGGGGSEGGEEGGREPSDGLSVTEKATTHPDTPGGGSPCPDGSPPVRPPFPPLPRKAGWGGGREDGLPSSKGSFYISAEKQRPSWSYNNCLADTVTKTHTTEEVLSPPFVLLLLEQPRVKVQPPSRHMAESQGPRD